MSISATVFFSFPNWYSFVRAAFFTSRFCLIWKRFALGLELSPKETARTADSRQGTHLVKILRNRSKQMKTRGPACGQNLSRCGRTIWSGSYCGHRVAKHDMRMTWHDTAWLRRRDVIQLDGSLSGAKTVRNFEVACQKKFSAENGSAMHFAPSHGFQQSWTMRC